MSKRRVTALLALAGLLDVYLAGGCHTPGHGCCWKHREVSGKTHVCDLPDECGAGAVHSVDVPAAPGDAVVEPRMEPIKPAPAPAVTETEDPAVEFPTVDVPRAPVTVQKPEPQDVDPAPKVTDNRPEDWEKIDPELPPAAITEPEHAQSDAVANDPAPATEKKPEAVEKPETVPATDPLAILKNLGAVVKFDRNRDPFGDKETMDAVVGVDLSSAHITDADLKLLAGLKNIREVDLSGTPVTDTGLKAIQSLSGLELLWLNGTKVTDAGLESIAGMTELKSLGLANTSIGDAGTRRLAGLKQLEYLLLAQTQVSDEGLEQLRSLASLKGLSLMGSQVTPQGVKRLREALPNCQVVFNTKKEQSALPLFQRRPFGWFPHLIASRTSSKDSQKHADKSAGNSAELEVSHDEPRFETPGEATIPAPNVVADDARSLDAAGQACIAEGCWDEAISKLKPAVEAAPDNVLIRYHLAVALGRSGRIDAALPHFVKTVGEAEAHYNIGVILYEAGNLDESERHLNEALRIKPDLTVARDQLDELRRELQGDERPVHQTAFFRRFMFRP